jgi:phosphonate transport system permease protein
MNRLMRSSSLAGLRPSTPPSTPLVGLALVMVAGVLALLPTQFWQRDLLNLRGWPQMAKFFVAALHPNLSHALLQTALNAALTTLAYAVCGTFLTVVIGLVLGVLSTEAFWQTWVRQGWPARFFLALLTVPRAIHELLWALFFLNIWGLNALTAIVAIAIPFGAITAKIFAELIDDTPRETLERLRASGASTLTAFFYSLLPQAFLNLLSYGFYRFECALRSAAVLGVIGAGGLGQEIRVSLDGFKYPDLWTFFYSLLLLNGSVDWLSADLRRRLNCVPRTQLRMTKNLGAQMSRIAPTLSPKAPSIPVLMAIALVPVALSFWYLHPDLGLLWAPRSQRLFHSFIQELWPPRASALTGLLGQTLDTAAMSVLAILLAAAVGLLLAFPAASNLFAPGGLLNASRSGVLGIMGLWGSRLLLLLARAIPAPIWALVILYVVFPGILPGAIALGIHNLGILGRLMAETIENLETPPLETLQTTGAKPSGIFLYGVLPMTMPRFVSYALYRWEVCGRETVIVGLVGAGGLGRSLSEQLTSFDYRSLVVTLGAFLLLTLGIDTLSGIARRSLR